MKTDFSVIDKYLDHHKNNKPPMVSVSDEDWSQALDGYYNVAMEAVSKDTTIETAWTLIYFSAIAFCRGMEYAEVNLNKREPSNYPRY